MLERCVEETIRSHGLIEPGEAVLAAVSGGVDSIVLLDVLVRLSCRYGWRMVVAHFHHGIRLGEADSDAAFVEALARSHELPVEIGRAGDSEWKSVRGLSAEMGGRRLRYRFLDEAARRLGASKIATGHHVDDQAETLLLRLFVGTGPRGLRGILPIRGAASGAGPAPGERIIRPLLCCSRAEILRYAEARGLSWVEDRTNRDEAVRRNRVRHDLLPRIEAVFGARVKERLARLAGALREDEAVLEALAEAFSREIATEPRDGVVEFDIEGLLRLPAALRKRLLVRWIETVWRARGSERGRVSHRHLESLLRLAAEGRGEVSLPGGARAHASKGRVRICGGEEVPAGFDVELPDSGLARIPEAGLTARLTTIVAEKAAPATSTRVDIDRRVIDGKTPLRLRSRRPGDRFHPFGAPGTRRLKAFLIDAGVPAFERDRLPLLVDARGTVLWVVGLRPSEALRIRPEGLRREPGAPFVRVEVEGVL